MYRRHYTDIEGVSSDTQLVGRIIVIQHNSEPDAPEPLTSEQRAARLHELEEWGVDLSLVRTALARTPTQRLLHLQDLSDSIKQMQQAWRRQYEDQVRHAQQMTVDTDSDV